MPRAPERQLELPVLAAAGRRGLTGPTPKAPGRLRHIQLGTRVLPYWFRRARRRTIGIAIEAQGLVAAAPRWATIAEVEAFIREKQRWVLRRLEEARRNARPPFLWQEGARLPYLGRDVALARTVWGRVRLAGERLEVPAIAFDAAARLRELVIGWLHGAALAHFRERIAAYAPAMGVGLPEVALSNAASQWGSCTQTLDGRGRVLLHWKLVHFEPRLVDYVVVHELAHLRHMNHSAAFWRLVGSQFREHAQARRELRERGHLIPDL
jgi:predicted metal-dependent hydrolase